MNLTTFAEQHRVKVTKDSCGDPIIQGKAHPDANISEHDGGMLAMCFMGDSTGRFRNVRKACLAAGFRLVQEGDSEGIFVFDPSDKAQAKLAIKSARVRVKRQMTPEQVAVLSNRLAIARNSARNLQKNTLIST